MKIPSWEQKNKEIFLIIYTQDYKNCSKILYNLANNKTEVIKYVSGETLASNSVERI